MHYLLFSILAISIIGLFTVLQAFADHDTDEQWGTLYVEKPVLELPYSAWDNSEYKKIKIFGTVEDPRSATWVFFTITEPDGKTSQVTTVPRCTVATLGMKQLSVSSHPGVDEPAAFVIVTSS